MEKIDGKIEKKPVREIKNIPLRKFFVPEEEKVKASDILEEEKKAGKIPHQPFEPGEALKTIRHLSDEQKKMPKWWQRIVVRVRLEEYKDALAKQKLGIADTIGQLRAEVENRPGSSPEDLRSIIRTNTVKYRFGADVIRQFVAALNQYQEKHGAVEKYRALYSDDKQFFGACFGVLPSGKIEVVKRPMTLSFRCFDGDDYALAENFDKTKGDKNKLTAEMKAGAGHTGGRTLHVCAIPELAGAITIENASGNKTIEKRIVNKERVLPRGEEFVIPLKNQQEVAVEVKNFGTYKLKVLQRDKDGKPEKIQLIENDKIRKDLDVFPVTVTSPGGFRDIHDTSRFISSEIYESFVVREDPGGEHGWLSIEINNAFVTIRSQARDASLVTYQEVIEDEVLRNKKWAEETVIHEEQHQFNKLFKPLEVYLEKDAIKKEAVGEIKPRPAEQVIKSLIRGLVRHERKFMGIDSYARDEILAFYKDGSSLAYILETLSTSLLYDYRGMRYFKEKIDKISNDVIETGKEMSDILWESEDRGSDPIEAKKLSLSEEDIKKSIEKVFGEEYLLDLEKWVSAIAVLEKKNYSREEIVSMLYQEPVNHWVKLAKRAEDKDI